MVAHRSEWRNAIRPVDLPRVDNRNLIAGQIGAFPLYAAFVDMGDVDGETNEQLVYPILALFLIGSMESENCHIDLVNVGRLIRNLFYQGDFWRIRLLKCLDEKKCDPNNIQPLLDCLSNQTEFHWTKQVVNQLGPTRVPIMQDDKAGHQKADSEPGDMRPVNRPIQSRQFRKNKIKIARIRQPRPDSDDVDPIGLSP